MQHELLLLRHGKAGNGAGDFNRELTDKGRQDARKMAAWLLAESLVPDWIVSSTAKRAMQTAAIARDVMGLKEGKVADEAGIYEADLEDLLSILSNQSDRIQRLMLVGHNPGFSTLASVLTGNNLEIKTAGLVHLEMKVAWCDAGMNTAALAQQMSPKHLPHQDH